MKEPTFNGRVLLSMDVIEAARAGDPLALERVLRYYDRYINKICTRTLYDKDGLPHIEIDEYMKHRSGRISFAKRQRDMVCRCLVE